MPAAGWDAAGHDLWLTIGANVAASSSLFANVGNFTSTGAGGTTLAGDFATSGYQYYNNAVTLIADAKLAGTDLTFMSTVTGTGPGHDLTLAATSGPATLGGAMSGIARRQDPALVSKLSSKLHKPGREG